LKTLYKKYKSLPDDIEKLFYSLVDDPQQGTPLGKNCYKIRLNISSKQSGKSGGARVITHVYIQGDMVTLIAIYDKSSQSSISDTEIEKRLNEIN
jgi:mRNA-degrading endonuclease RelE of RelBE toxin-antitoxin system